MPLYCQEKYEKASTGDEKIVYWQATKHTHDAGMITEVKRRLGATFGGTWDVRANSYQSNQSKPPSGKNAVDLDDLHEAARA
jgi:hypothetical protein